MDNSISLNKFISDTGYCSRREADKLIEAGRVLLNNEIAITGNRYHPGDIVEVDGSYITETKKDKLVYIALNKPVGITTTSEEHIKGNIITFLNYPKRIFPIGRLDKDSEGLILLTNDGDIVNRILRAENRHEKEYVVRVNKPITPEFLHKMSSGLPILGTRTKPCKVHMMGRQTFRIILTQGLNRQIRRMCEYLGYNVVSLQRIRIMNIKLDKLATGKWRYLSEAEFDQLQASLENPRSGSSVKIRKHKPTEASNEEEINRVKKERPSFKQSHEKPGRTLGKHGAKKDIESSESTGPKKSENKAKEKSGTRMKKKSGTRKGEKSGSPQVSNDEKFSTKKNKSFKEYRKKGRGGKPAV